MIALFLQRHSPRQRRAGGFVFVDLLVGLGLIGLVLVAMFSTLGLQKRAAQKLSDTRTAARVAEDSLAAWRAGRISEPPADASVEVVPLDEPAPANCRWVRATARVGRGTAALVGLIPSEAKLPERGSP
jgi:type II secretory pathway pseudopilin PulG